MRYLRWLGLIALLGSVGMSFVTVSQTVSAADAVVSGATCTRDDLADAVSNASSGGTVTFDCEDPIIQYGVFSEIEISAGQTVTIDGSNGQGDQIVLRGGGDALGTQFFKILEGGRLIIQHVTMEEGYAAILGMSGLGGAITNQGGSLEVISSTFRHNLANDRGGAIFNSGGSVTIDRSVFVQNAAGIGGAVVQTGPGATMTISDSRFEENTAVLAGGAIGVESGTMTIRRSTFVENSSSGAGAIYGAGGEALSVIASTFTGNTASSAGSVLLSTYPQGVASLRWSTVIQAPNTVPALGFILSSSVTLDGVILGGEGPHCTSAFGTLLLPDSHTLANDSSCNLDGEGSANNVTDLELGPLTSSTVNGVEQSYFTLLEGSSALDAAPAATCDTDVQGGPNIDQLGTVRPVSSFCDIGAIEFVPYIATLCANRWNGSLSMASNDECGRGDSVILLPWDVPLDLCVNDWTGAASVADNCSRSEHSVTLQGTGEVEICVNNWNGAIRVSDRCNRSERADAL